MPGFIRTCLTVLPCDLTSIGKVHCQLGKKIFKETAFSFNFSGIEKNKNLVFKLQVKQRVYNRCKHLEQQGFVAQCSGTLKSLQKRIN